MQAATPAYKTVIAGASQTVEHNVMVTLPQTAGLSRVNLATDPSIEGTTTLWVASGNPAPAISISTAHAFAGTHSLLVTWATGNIFLTNGVYPLVTTPGLVYTISAYVWVPSGGSPAVFLYASGVGLGGFSGASTLNDQWQRLNVTFTANATFHYIGVTPSGTPTAGQTCYVDALLIEQGSTLGSYFDGTYPGASWTGDPNRSTSTLRTNPYQDVSLTVESLSVDRQLTTDMPDGTRLITGYPAASAQVTLSGLVDQTPGASKSIAWLLNPAEPTSPMYRSDALGAPITIQTGVYTGGTATAELFTIFTGSVDDYTVDVQAGTVTLSCLDARSQFGIAPPLPLGAFSDDTTSATYLTNGVAQLLTSGWVLNLMCESLGLYTSPPPRNQAMVRITNHGGTWPELGPAAAVQVGALPGATAGAGKFASQVPSNSFVQWWNNPPVGNPNGNLPGDIGSSGNAWFFECWIAPDTSTAATVSPNTALHCTLNNTGGGAGIILELGAVAASVGADLTPYVFVFQLPGSTTTQVSPASLTIPDDGQWHYYSAAFHYTSTTAFTVVFTVDGASQTANGTLPAAATAHLSPASLLIQHLCPAESLQLTNEPGTPPSNNGFTPSALVNIDPSFNDLTAIPDVTGQDAWNVIQSIAEAEGAVAGFDELGVFRFENRDTIRTQVSQRTITPTYSLKTLQQELGLSFVRNHIEVPVNALQVQAPSVVWDTGSTLNSVSPHGTKQLFVSTDNPVTNVNRVGQVMPTGGGIPGLSYYRACYAPNGKGSSVTNLTMIVTQLSSNRLLIQITNPNAAPVWLVSPTDAAFPVGSIGVPILRVGGVNITPISAPAEAGADSSSGVIADSQWPPVTDGGAAANPRGEKILALTSNSFVQDTDAAQSYADNLLSTLYQPRPLWRNVSVVPDPSLQLADLVTITDPVTTLVNGGALIIGTHLTASHSDWSQTLDLRSTGMPGKWILGIAGSSELSTTTYL
jgi:hypothetical protein